MKIPKRIENALKILSLWYESFEELRTESPMHRRTALRWKAIGVVNHDRMLNGEPVPVVPLRTTDQVIGR